MKNLAQFKRRLTETLNNGGTVNFQFKDVTLFGSDHPGREKYPEGLVRERTETGCKIGRVQSNSFTRITGEGKESWLDFGKSSDWEFPDENTAICRGGSYEDTDHKVIQTLTYTFV